jgi:hypothetical protein
VRIPVSIFSFLALFLAACNRDHASYNFDDASEEAQQAMAANVEFTLNEDIFRKWEQAQANLEQLPSEELERAPDPGGSDPVTRGIRRLEASPRARRAIESAGLSVRNFVLATVALAQAVKASRSGVPPTVGAIASNVRFVMAHSSRLSNRGAASIWVPPSELSEDEIAAQQAMEMDSASQDEEIATGAEGAQPTVPQLEDWSRQPQPPQPTLPRPRDTQRSTNQPQIIPVPPPTPPPTQDSSSGSERPPRTDSLTTHQQDHE